MEVCDLPNVIKHIVYEYAMPTLCDVLARRYGARFRFYSTTSDSSMLGDWGFFDAGRLGIPLDRIGTTHKGG
jgi:hypothetical protein